MKSRTRLNLLSGAALVAFSILAGGSLDDSSTGVHPQAAPADSSPPVTEKDVVINGTSLDYTWFTDGMIMTANFKVHNATDHAFKDFEITCDHSAPSGTVIDHNTRTIYELIPAKSTKSFRNFNMGFINSQAHSSSCRITNLVLVN
jgi:hypothetical protein